MKHSAAADTAGRARLLPHAASGYFVAVVVDGEMAVVTGDMAEEAYRKTRARRPPGPGPVLIPRREHVSMRDAGGGRGHRNWLFPARDASPPDASAVLAAAAAPPTHAVFIFRFELADGGRRAPPRSPQQPASQYGLAHPEPAAPRRGSASSRRPLPAAVAPAAPHTRFRLAAPAAPCQGPPRRRRPRAAPPRRLLRAHHGRRRQKFGSWRERTRIWVSSLLRRKIAAPFGYSVGGCFFFCEGCILGLSRVMHRLLETVLQKGRSLHSPTHNARNACMMLTKQIMLGRNSESRSY
ncbi:hypothetical protein C2845_PM11G19450 [Panicum miliaceum]|uniref:Uncharacterized protein n=1 Tax=Panicum miliaceum TaxID=4540 RepID=A0A3L6RRW3_PANMI|nr:hypothetical protein C2845_PM11G19450 [Panicum miliaceum]